MAGVASEFWKGKRVFITGHTGFKGVWLSLWLQSLGATPIGYSTSSGQKNSIVAMESFQGNICDFKNLRAAMLSSKPEIVLHMAAQPLVRRAFHDPLGTYTTNVIGTATLLEAVRECSSVRAVIVITTDKCYENQNWDWAYREADPLGGSDPYSSSKACMELVVRSFRDSFFSKIPANGNPVGVATARAGNMLGGGDWAEDRLIPDMMRSFATGKPVTLRSPLAMRPWQFVLETLRGYLLLAERLSTDAAQYSGAWNFAPATSDVQPVQWIAEKLATAWGKEARWEIQPGSFSQESQMVTLDCSKAAAELSWRPVMHLAEALEMTVDWYRAFYAGENVLEKYRQQIAAYSLKTEQQPEILSEASSKR